MRVTVGIDQGEKQLIQNRYAEYIAEPELLWNSTTNLKKLHLNVLELSTHECFYD